MATLITKCVTFGQQTCKIKFQRRIRVRGNPKMLVHDLRSSLGKIQNWPLYKEGKERLKKETDHSRLINGRFSKQGILHARQIDLCTHLLAS